MRKRRRNRIGASEQAAKLVADVIDTAAHPAGSAVVAEARATVASRDLLDYIERLEEAAFECVCDQWR
jgi:hypothetical protein